MPAVPAPAASRGPAVLRKALIQYCIRSLVFVAILRFTSGRGDWLRAWGYVAFTMGFQVVVGALLHRLNPDLLEERSRMRKGTKPFDKVLAPAVAVVGPVAMWVIAGLDVRAHWPPPVPVSLSALAFAMCAAGAALTTWAMLVNRFFSATVRIQSERGHAVVDSGPYRYVRHPGYTGILLFSLASPLALGSWLALYAGAFMAAALLVRTALEDRTLRAELPGYAEYASRVANRLVPGLW